MSDHAPMIHGGIKCLHCNLVLGQINDYFIHIEIFHPGKHAIQL